MKKQKINGISFLAGEWPINKSRATIIFIHGSGLSKNLWVKQVSGLADQINTVAIDLPGHGDSDGEASNEVGLYAKALEDLIKALEIDRPVLCGLSMGGAVVLHMIINPAMDYSGAVLLNTGARLKVLPLILETIKNDYDKFIELSKGSLISDDADEESIRLLMDDIADCSPQAAYADFELCNNFDVMSELGLIEVPVLVITCGEDKMTPEKYGVYLCENINNSTRVHIEGSGHMAPVEKGDEVSEAIGGFVEGNYV